MAIIPKVKSEWDGKIPTFRNKVSALLNSGNDDRAIKRNPFLDKTGNLVNPYIDYQKILDDTSVSNKVKTLIQQATGLTPTATAVMPETDSPTAPNVSTETSNVQPSNTEGYQPVDGNSDWIFPVKSSSYRISSGFGPRNTGIPGASKNHKAIDIAASGGTDIVSVKNGVVTRSGWVKGYGNTVEISHGNGIVTKYHHMQDASPLKVGQNVSAGQTVGKVGSTGISSGNHLDFQLFIDGVAVDPMKYLK